MPEEKIRCLLVSDFHTGNLAAYLRQDTENPVVVPIEIPFGEYRNALAGGDLASWKENPEIALVWTQPEGAIASWNRALRLDVVTKEEILKEVDDYAGLIVRLASRLKAVFVPAWVLPTFQRGYGLLDRKHPLGLAPLLDGMNLALAERLRAASNVHLLNTHKWIEAAGKRAFDPKLWYLAKIPFGNEVWIEAAAEMKTGLRGIAGESRRLVILDLDDTLWGGLVGESGWEPLQLGGHDAAGEAFCDFQHALKSLTRRGVLLAIVSKNEEAIALEAIGKHPEMILREKDFAAWKINWQDKAENVLALLGELNLGPESAVFIDNNPADRARVREALPGLFVPDWPEDPMLYRSTLLALRCFDSPYLTLEDRGRSQMLERDRDRRALRAQLGSVEDWLRGLQTRVRVEELNEGNLERAVQLLNKTNQMNLATRRLTRGELTDWLEHGRRKCWTFRVSDKFGDSGLTGFLSLEFDNRHGQIVDFVLSCRVLGRQVEEAMLYAAVQFARAADLEEISARYLETARNKPCLEFWKKSGWKFEAGANRFLWKTGREYPRPSSLELTGVLDDPRKRARRVSRHP